MLLQIHHQRLTNDSLDNFRHDCCEVNPSVISWLVNRSLLENRCEMMNLPTFWPYQLRRLDKLQRWFLRELGISDQDAFVQYNFAPPTLRRNIGLLGFLQKRVLGECHPALCHALPFGPPDIVARYHTKHLVTFSGLVVRHARIYERSLFAYIRVYNRLPQTLADSPSVKKNFQNILDVNLP